jgi:hypothetical protein
VSDFEFLFALFGLLLGLSLAEVLGGLARAIDARLRPGAAARLGWLTPLLGTFVLIDLISFWGAAWVSREAITVSSDSLLLVMAFAGAYFLAAALVFPRQIDAATDFDTHYFRVRRTVMGVLLVLLACQMAWYTSVPAIAARLVAPLSLAATTILAVLMVLAMVVRSERWSRIVLLALVARYLILIVIV